MAYWCSGGRNFSVYLTLTRSSSGHGYAGALKHEIYLRDEELKKQSEMNIELLKIINELNDRLLNLENKTLIEEGI